MAQPAVESLKFRDEATRLVSAMRDASTALAIIEDMGADDAARAAFFADAFGEGTDNPDITFAEFAAAAQAVRDMLALYNQKKLALAKLIR